MKEVSVLKLYNQTTYLHQIFGQISKYHPVSLILSVQIHMGKNKSQKFRRKTSQIIKD